MKKGEDMCMFGN